jgi:hypothetical protein
MKTKYNIKRILIVFIIVSFIFFFSINCFFRNKNTYENFDNTDDLIMNKEEAFCEHHKGKSLELNETCGKLTHKNCNSTSCCVWNTMDTKCVAGNENGPTFNTDSNGKTLSTDYYHKNVFYKSL